MQRLCEVSEFPDLGKFWKISKVKIPKYFFSFLVSQNLFFLLESKKKKFKRPTFYGGKQFFRIWKLWEIFGKFWKMQCSRTFHTLGRVCVQIFSSLLNNSLKMRLPQKNYITQKVSLPKKCSTPKNGSSPKIVSSSKIVSSPKNVSLPKKCFTWKIWLTQKSF